MPMDGLTIGAVVYEINTLLCGARVDKINQPEDDELHILCRINGENHKLLMCTNASFARLNITTINKQNPPTPTNFCMLLRKHLTGSKIAGVTQYQNERIVTVDFDCLNDFNEPVTKRLILEIMGKHSNIIFVDENMRIYDSIKRVNSLMSRVRLVQPGMEYQLPPSQRKTDPFTAVDAEYSSPRIISDTFTGISKQAAEELFARSKNERNGFNTYLQKYKCKDFSPVLLIDDNNTPVDFFAVEQIRFLPQFQLKLNSVSEAIDRFFVEKDKAQRIQERAHGLKLKLNNLLEKAQKKQAQQQEKLIECADMEKYRVYGELLTVNIYMVKKGIESITVQNYYEDNAPLEIPLDNKLSASANAQKYFKHYNKLKTASKLLTSQMEQTENEIDFFITQLENLEKSENDEDINEIRLELVNAGYIKAAKDKKKNTPSKPMHFISSTGIDIYVGKNNTQNDNLTFHFADSDDLWLHTKDIHGSHVIVHSAVPDDITVNEAAMLAAYFSKGRSSSSVPVDATKRRYVRKPSGSLPGKAVYTNQTTYYVTPDEQSVKQLKKI